MILLDRYYLMFYYFFPGPQPRHGDAARREGQQEGPPVRKVIFDALLTPLVLFCSGMLNYYVMDFFDATTNRTYPHTLTRTQKTFLESINTTELKTGT